ncbi:MAG: hypothetical protein IPP29_23705 [Bacteroidetes bacterium]|nr:hypothetical protein [Bacteroidota bacterium]
MELAKTLCLMVALKIQPHINNPTPTYVESVPPGLLDMKMHHPDYLMVFIILLGLGSALH